jgi:hypothetical protein
MDVHYKSSHVTFRDADGRVVAREQLDHTNRAGVREQLKRWPKGIPIVLEASFGWGWLSDLMEEVGLSPQLSNCYKVDGMRKTRGWAKTNKKDADLLSLLPKETQSDAEPWWKVWRAPADVRGPSGLARRESREEPRGSGVDQHPGARGHPEPPSGLRLGL